MAAEESTSANCSDNWSEEATHTLIESWAEEFINVNRGNLCQYVWYEIVKTVNKVHGRCSETFKTEIQCKNRLDRIKRRFKFEKAKTDRSNGIYESPWMFYKMMDFLIGKHLRYQSRNARAVLPPPGSPPLSIESQNGTVPVNNDEREVPLLTNEAMENGPVANDLVVAAAAEEEEMEEEEEEEEMEVERGVKDEWKSMVKAMEGFEKVYERVERMKMTHIVELEKERMRFAKELELERMKMFVDMQVYLEETRVKRAGSDDGTSTKRRRT